MDKDKKLARLSLDMPIEMHRKLKALAAFHGRSIRNISLDALMAAIQLLQTMKEEDESYGSL